jgi:hypothetical protein
MERETRSFMAFRFAFALIPAFFTADVSFGQATKKKESAKEESPAARFVGVWHEKTSSGDEYMTVTADGRMILKKGAETIKLTWRLDPASIPWKLELKTTTEPIGTLYTVIEIEGGKFRMARPTGDAAMKPGAEELKQGTSMKRFDLEPNAGIHQVMEAHLKALAGTWEGRDGGERIELTLTADGTYRFKVAGEVDKGRFRIDVSKVPCVIDWLSTEGAGPKFTIYELTPDKSLRFGRAGASAAERPKAFEETDKSLTRVKN